MGFFGRKKNKAQSPKKTNKSNAATPPPERAQPSQPQPQTTVVKYVGGSKLVTTNRIDAMGRQVSQTQVIKLTREEMEELGIAPTEDANEEEPAAGAAGVAASSSNHHQAQGDEHSMAGYSMMGYSLGGFSDILPPASDDAEDENEDDKDEDGQKNGPVKQPPAAGRPASQPRQALQPPQHRYHAPPPSTMMATPVYEASASASTSSTSSNVSQHHQQQVQQIEATAAAVAAAPNPSESYDDRLAAIEVTRDLVKKFISEIWNRGEVELIPTVCHPSLRFNGHVGMDRVGHEGFARMVTTVREALSDYHCEIHSMVVETNKAFCRLRFTGKHSGNLLGYAPTGKTVAWMGASEFTCKNGKILKVWELADLKSLEEQLKADT